MKAITIEPENESKVANWLKNRGGIAVWKNCDLGSPSIGCESYTPATHEDGKMATSPHWQYGNTPDRVITDPADVLVQVRKEVSRVKIRRGPPYLGGVNRADRPRLDAALEKAGEGAAWQEDWSNMKYGSAWFEAVITVVESSRPLNMA